MLIAQTPSPNPSNGIQHRTPPQRPPKPKYSPKSQNGVYPNSQLSVSPGKIELNDSADRDYEVLSPNAKLLPIRPAPQPLNQSSQINSVVNYGTLPGSSDLDGVPFVLNPFLSTQSNPAAVVSAIPIKYLFYHYIFYAYVFLLNLFTY